MATATLDKPLHREDHPPRRCANRSCRAWLRSTNPGPYCSPCSTPESELVEEEDLLKLIAQLPRAIDRRRAFLALEERAEEAA